MVEFLRPATWEEALAAKAAHPASRPIAGGTDVMVEMNFGRSRPQGLLDLTSIPELAAWERDGTALRVGAAVPYSRIIDELGADLPGLAMASRTVGSPQIRNRGTLGGNLGSASPAGDAHPPLLACGAEVEIASAARGSRLVPVAEFFTGPKRSVLAEDELIRAVRIRCAAGPQQFSKIGTRNAMVIAVCSFGLALHPAAGAAAGSGAGSGQGWVGTGIGSAAPTPLRAHAAEDFLAGELDWASRGPLAEGLARRFGELVAEAASPVDDVRGTAAYRRHALSVIARRTLTWAWKEYTACG